MSSGPVPDEEPQTYASRLSQISALASRAIYTRVDDPEDDTAVGALLELYLREQPLGQDYVSHFVYSDYSLPVTIAGVLLDGEKGLCIGEIEIFRAQWGYFNDYGDYVGPNGDWIGKDDEDWDRSALPDPPAERQEFVGISGALLRSIPVGRILAWAHQGLADEGWRDEGVRSVGLSDSVTVTADALPPVARDALERAVSAGPQRRGRPPLADDLLIDVSLAYLEEQKRGRGLTRRMAERFDRPEETVRDWIHVARKRGFLTTADPGRRGAFAGERLLDYLALEDDSED